MATVEHGVYHIGGESPPLCGTCGYSEFPMPSPRFEDHHRHADAIIAAALGSADPGRAIAAAWAAAPPVETGAPYALLAVGKAAPAMTAGWLRQARTHPNFGLLVAPAGLLSGPAGVGNAIDVIASDHPLPTERSVDAGQAALDVAERARREGIPLIVLLSGGASSLMCVPEAGLTVDDLRACTDALLRAGAGIDELNAVRAHCDLVKGGRLAAAAAPSPVVTLILSDVIGDRLDVIGSGPTVAPGATPADALAVLKRRKVERACRAVASHLRMRAVMPVEPPDCSHSTCRIIANNQTAVDAAARGARELGFEIGEVKAGIAGEARDAAFAFMGVVRQARSRARGRPVAVVWGGETTVTVKGRGRGGRNLEAALAAAVAIDGDGSLVMATLATDGVDGASDAAGAIVTGRTAAMARQAGVDPEAYLANSNSHGFFERADRDALIKTGPTGTNVNDLWVALSY